MQQIALCVSEDGVPRQDTLLLILSQAALQNLEKMKISSKIITVSRYAKFSVFFSCNETITRNSESVLKVGEEISNINFCYK